MPSDGEQNDPATSDGEQSGPAPSDGEQGDPVPSDEEQNGAEQYSFEDSGEYVRVSIAGSCAGEEKPTAHAAELRDDEKYAVLEAWTVDVLCDDCSLKLTAEMTALPELSEGEHLALVPVCGENVGEALDMDMEAGDKLELELAPESAEGIALIRLFAENEETPGTSRSSAIRPRSAPMRCGSPPTARSRCTCAARPLTALTAH